MTHNRSHGDAKRFMFKITANVLTVAALLVGWNGQLMAARRPKSPVEFRLHVKKAPKWTAEEKKRGFVVCSDHWMRPMFDVFMPTREQIVKELRCKPARGEYESLQVGVHALRDIGPVKITVELDLPFKTYRFMPLDRKLTVLTTADAGKRILQKQPVKMPYFLFPRTEHAKVVGGRTAGFWITIQAPADAQSGEHTG